MGCHSCHQKGHLARECPANATEGRSGNGQKSRSWRGTDFISPCGSRGTGSASWSIRDPGRQFWLHGLGALECLGRGRLTVTLGTWVIEWSFIVAEIRDEEGILGMYV